MILKLLGAIDIFSALIILFNIYHIHWIITDAHVIILIAKGIPSMISNPLGIALGAVDIITAMFILFGVTGLLPLKAILFIIMVYKGSLSLL